MVSLGSDLVFSIWDLRFCILDEGFVTRNVEYGMRDGDMKCGICKEGFGNWNEENGLGNGDLECGQ